MYKAVTDYYLPDLYIYSIYTLTGDNTINKHLPFNKSSTLVIGILLNDFELYSISI